MRVQRPGADFERAVHRGNLPGGQQPVVVVFRGNLSPDGLYASSLEGCRDRRTTIRSPSHTADPPRTHTLRCRHTGHDPQESRYGNGVAELGTDIRRMLSDRRHDF